MVRNWWGTVSKSSNKDEDGKNASSWEGESLTD
jgi:hypothetical protein